MLSALLKSSWVAVAAFLAIAALVIGIRIKDTKIDKLRLQNESLSRQIDEYRDENDSLVAQHTLIIEALTHAAEQKQAAEQESVSLRTRLQSAQRDNDCSHRPVPDDVIRMQREAITKTNRLFADPQDTTASVPAP